MNTEQLFSILIEASDILYLRNERSEKLEQIRSVEKKECGNCRKWMTKDCEIETRTGRLQRYNNFCGQIEWIDKGGLLKIFKKELSEIEDKIANITTCQGKIK